MAMQNGQRLSYGDQRTDDIYVFGGVGNSVTIIKRVIASLNELSDVTSGSGNFKSPVPQRFSHLVQTASTGNWYQKVKFGPSDYISSTISGVQGRVAGVIHDTNLDANVVNKALSGMNDQMRNTIDLSTDVAQAGQTKGMLKSAAAMSAYVLRHPAKALKQAYQDYVKSPGGTKKFTKDAGSKWLEFQYGWKPLAQTLWDCGQAAMRDSSQRLTVKGRASGNVNRVENYYGEQNYRSVRVITDEVRCEIRCDYAINQSALQTMSGYTSLNPASIAWELTPYSFVVDWFVDVGGYLRNFETALLTSQSFIGGYRTIGVRTFVNEIVSQGFSNESVEINGSLTGSTTNTSKQRVNLVAAPLPRLPTFKAELGSGRLLNAAALLSQHLK